MVLVRDLVKVPSYYIIKNSLRKDYDIKYNLLKWNVYLLGYNKYNDLNVLDFKVRSVDSNNIYYVSIGTKNVQINFNSYIKVYCTCPDFAYTYAYVLYKNDALLYPDEFPVEFKTIPPKKRNPDQIIFICKHVYTILKYCLENNLQFNEQTVLRYNKYNRYFRPIYTILHELYQRIEKVKRIILGQRSKRGK